MENNKKQEVNEKMFDEKIEGYDKCGSTHKEFDCKRDCWIEYSPLLSYLH